MASLRKQQASRANSLRSTGPKSTLGKRLASQNSRTHGLSVALPDEVIEPVVTKLVPLIMQDGIDSKDKIEIARVKLTENYFKLGSQKLLFEVTRTSDLKEFHKNVLDHKQELLLLCGIEEIPDATAT